MQEEVFDLFAALDATDEQLDFPTLYASAKEGWAAKDLETPRVSMAPLFELIAEHFAAPAAKRGVPFAMLSTILEYDNYLGRILTGRIERGSARVNMPVVALRHDGRQIEAGRLTKLLAFRGIERVPVNEAHAGDLIAIAGLKEATVADTICDPENAAPVRALPVDPPTLSMSFSINDLPFAGNDGDKVTSRLLAARLERESE